MATNNDQDDEVQTVTKAPKKGKAPVGKKKVPRRKHFTRLTYWFSLVIALLVGLIVGVLIVTVQVRKNLVATAETRQIDQVYQLIQKNYYTKVSKKKLANGAISGMLKSLDDPFSEYLATEETSNLNESISGSFEGIGAQVQKDSAGIKIVSPIKNAPAAKAGLKANDIILAIDGQSTAKMTVNDAVSKIRGKKGSSVQLKIKRGSNTFTVKVKRGKVDQATVTGALSSTDKQVGVIQITTFAENTVSGMKKTIKSLRKQGAKSFVLDLRGNGGGLMNTALSLSSMFLQDKKVIMRVVDRDQNETVYRAGKKYDDGFKVTEPVTVIVDSGSASASEIFTAALQQSAGDKVVGTQSFGKGTVQTVIPLSESSEMKFTTAKWLTPNKTWINKVGITPDTVVDYPAIAKLTLISNDATLKNGDVSDQVKLLQENLQALGYRVDNTKGIFDDSTTAAVKQLQTKAGLTATGEFNEDTYTALYVQVAAYLQAHDEMLSTAVKTSQEAQANAQA